MTWRALQDDEDFDPLCRFQFVRRELQQLPSLPASSPHRTGKGLGFKLLLRIGGEVDGHALRHGQQREVAIGKHLSEGALKVAAAQRVAEPAQQLRLSEYQADRVAVDKFVVQRRCEVIQVVGGEGLPAPNTLKSGRTNTESACIASNRRHYLPT